MAKKKAAEPEKRGRGRPATGRKNDVRMTFRMTAEDRAAFEAAASREGMTLGVWALATLRAIAHVTRKNT